MIADDGMVIGPVGGGGGGAFVAGPHPGRVKYLSYVLSVKLQVVMSPTCLEVRGLAWTVSLFTGNVHNITLNMQLSWRSIKLTDLDIYQIWKKVSRNKEIL